MHPAGVTRGGVRVVVVVVGRRMWGVQGWCVGGKGAGRECRRRTRQEMKL